MKFVAKDRGITDDAPSFFKGSTLIWPVVSIGNVGQLCVDVLHASAFVMELKRVGSLFDRDVLPLVGYCQPCSIEGKAELALSLEVYHSSRWNITVVQQRAPIIQNQHEPFCKRAAEWIASVGFDEVLLLCSSPAYRRGDNELESDVQFNYQASQLTTGLGKSMQLLEWRRFCSSQFNHLLDGLVGNEDEEFALPFVGTGSLRPMFSECQKLSIPVATILSFVNEGDNSVDGLVQCSIVYSLLCQLRGCVVDRPDWITPPEWELVFGFERDPSMYIL
uniref:Proteasome assembly chaperone 2 n=1 Tax=Spongospora subterranea TaxID=70186 RepID=A0A0H5R9E5_9EUKA|eukprot:CRZ10401.1 hypothetical protein [Spongospora subterranea]